MLQQDRSAFEGWNQENLHSILPTTEQVKSKRPNKTEPICEILGNGHSTRERVMQRWYLQFQRRRSQYIGTVRLVRETDRRPVSGSRCERSANRKVYCSQRSG